ncbi:MAG TPA: response regulator [Gemmatimonadaceae bacterium]|nr:response regulator [Gemmatimonadaceae bacterium]
MSYLLCVDDNEDMRLMVREVLESAGHEVSLAPDGIAALIRIQEREPDLLVLDLVMPGMTGIDVCRAVKRNPFTARIPVLMLTAREDIEHKVAAFEAGADDYLAKPFDPRELRARVVALLRIVRREGDRNPTSGLPGGQAIEDEIERRGRTGKPFAVCYIDLDNFKPFADTFGFTVADTVIREMGSAIRGALGEKGGVNDFVGHIGGDDFIVVTDLDRAEPLAAACGRRFVEVLERTLGQDALKKGGFIGVDRDGRAREFPLASLSVAVLQVTPDRWISVGHIGALAAEVKRRAKQRGAGTILIHAV